MKPPSHASPDAQRVVDHHRHAEDEEQEDQWKTGLGGFDQHTHQPGLQGDDQVGLALALHRAVWFGQAAVQQAEGQQEAEGEPAQEDAVDLPQAGGSYPGQGQIGHNR